MKQVIWPSIALSAGSGADGGLYAASVSVTGGPSGHGRISGLVRSADGALELELRMPPELGGIGGGTNPEQLFAAGYAACFHGSLMLLAAHRGLAANGTEVAVTVSFGRDPTDGLFMLASHVRVRMPDLPRIAAAELVRDAERVCPYTKMARQGIESIVTLVEHGD
ncbi:peroxiredoxin [Massilia sp. WF1]|uniref:Ohr family peroxiredoxin n=1 Tax=unclassified Massilia TaxID=2609279 RepID=UPI0006498824|nr:MULTISPECIES: Ohr family peroxiredoxin [unclassified Massilia]ALK96087.1 peroxiredoxin [Massilia sp. WG5]KLU37330.1 peroxiredoxin [Massilia sp. WF1]